jgi:diguanylate cyclase
MNQDFQNIINQLHENEKVEVTSNNITVIEKLIPILLKRINPTNVSELSLLLKQSVLPSICSEIDNELEQLFNEIEKSPNLLFKRDVQKKIEDFITKRFQRDKQVVIEKTSDISKFVILMGQYLNDAISSNGSGSKNVLNIKEKIQAINIADNGIEDLTNLQNELVNAAASIESEMNEVTNKLQNGKSKVQELEEKVKTLEEELSRTKNQSMKDHLTGILTRGAYEEEVKRIESSYQRNNTQYAIVFFDLDFFKKINDTYGHKCGDVILSTFAKVLNKNTRDHDIVGRYGGEEFIAIVHFNLNRELLQYLKRIKTIVTENSFVCGVNKIKVTFSAGVAIRSSYDSYENAIQKSDMLLYQAKESGRNKIILENGMEI